MKPSLTEDKTMKIMLTQLIGPRCITAEQGKQLYEAIHPDLMEDREVVLDFEGVRSLVSVFLNNSVGLLFKDFERAQLDRLLRFENVTDSQMETLQRVMSNAEKYHRDPEYRKAVDEVLERQFEETLH
jgi:hypothetical protein